MTNPRWRHPSEKPSIIEVAESFAGSTEVDRLAIVMMIAWGNVDPESHVAQHPASYVATFADMARDALDHLREAHMLRPEPWPPIPYPDDAAHQVRWTLQRAWNDAHWKTGDVSEAMIAAADALIAEGWKPPTQSTEPAELSGYCGGCGDPASKHEGSFCPVQYPTEPEPER